MAKRTKLMVFVSKDIMDKPHDLFQAAMDHMRNKDAAAIEAKEDEPVGPYLRKEFMHEFMRAERKGEDCLKVISNWVTVRDISTFKLKPKKVEPDPEEEEGVSLDIVDEPDNNSEINILPVDSKENKDSNKKLEIVDDVEDTKDKEDNNG